MLFVPLLPFIIVAWHFQMPFRMPGTLLDGHAVGAEQLDGLLKVGGLT